MGMIIFIRNAEVGIDKTERKGTWLGMNYRNSDTEIKNSKNNL